MVGTFVSPTSIAAAITGANQICAPTLDPCIVDKTIDVEPGAVLDFGKRGVEIKSTGQLRADSTGLALLSGSLTIGQGGKISVGSTTKPGGSLTLVVEGTVRSAGELNAAGIPGGRISVDAGGAVQLTDGRLTANANDAESDGGVIQVTAASNILVSAPISAWGGAMGAGGDIAIEAGTVSVDDSVGALGGEGDGGDIEIIAAGNVIFTSNAIISVDGSGGGSAGDISVVAGNDPSVAVGPGTLVAAGRIFAVGAGTSEAGGSGGSVSLKAAAECRLSTRITATGASPDGEGGMVDIDCGADADTTLEGKIDVRGTGIESDGGEISVGATGALHVITTLDAGGAEGGVIELASDIAVVAEDGASLLTNGSGENAFGGTIRMNACSAALTLGSKISSAGRQGTVRITGVNGINVAGSITADATGMVELVSRDSAPFLQSTARIAPDPLITNLPNLPGCHLPTPLPGTATPTRSATPVPPSSTVTATVTPSRPTRVVPSSTPTRTGSPSATPSPIVTPWTTPAGVADANCDGSIDAAEAAGVIEAIFDDGFVAVCPNADANRDGQASAADMPALYLLIGG